MNPFFDLQPPSALPPPYQVGGSINPDMPCYVCRQADEQIYQALIAGEFCYVLTSRQMGKSSLMVKTLQRLQTAGYRCTTVDITSLGCHQVTSSQWYRGVIADLWRGFSLFPQFNYKTWWEAQGETPPVQKLHGFLQEALLDAYPNDNFVIFVDEIDSILSLDFSLDDFFALIRFCYNQRAVDANYQRLTFVILGVATPADLIQDRQRTPFNIGKAISLQGFQYPECQPLLAGLEAVITNAPTILQEILYWTGGQPFLTQKLCALLWQACYERGAPILVSPGTEARWVRQFVHDRIIHQWELQDEPEHLRTIRDRLLRHPHRAGRLLGLYQQILRAEQIPIENSDEETELLLSGLVSRVAGHLRVKSPIYRTIFDEMWVDYHLQNLRPYSQALQAWLMSERQDTSRLLRGQALKDAQSWAQGKRLGDEDYQFLAASVEGDRLEVQQALEAERGRAASVQLQHSQHLARLQRWLLGTISLGFVMSTVLGSVAWYESRRATQNEQLARISEVRALMASAEGWFDSNNRLDALLQAIHARRQLGQLHNPDPILRHQVDDILRKIILGVNEINRFSGHTDEIKDVAYRPDGNQIASVSKDNTLKLWHPDGTLLRSINHSHELITVSYSPSGDLLATGSGDGAIQLWNPATGELLNTLQNRGTRILSIAFSVDGQTLATGGVKGYIQLWRRDGTLLRTLKAHQAMVRSLAFSPDGRWLVSGSADRTLKFWSPTDGRLLKTLDGHSATVSYVAFSPDGRQLASASSDKTIKLWNPDGQLIKTLEGHQASVTSVQFSPDGQQLVSTSLDHEVRFWQSTGEPIKAYGGITAAGRSLAFSPDGAFLVSSGLAENHDLVLWRLSSPFYSVIEGHDAAVIGVAHSPIEDLVATASVNGSIKLWQTNGTLMQTVVAHEAPVIEVGFSHDGKTLISSSMDGTIRLWSTEGRAILTYRGHTPDVARAVFAPGSDRIASAGVLSDLRLWRPDGQDEKTLPISNIGALAWHPKNDLMALSDGNSNIQLWNSHTEVVQQTLTGHTANIRDLDFDAEGRRLASASEDGTVRLWDGDNGEAIATLSGHTDLVWDVTFAPVAAEVYSGVPFLASASADKTIRLWTVDGELITILDKHDAAVHRLTFSPDGRWLFSASSDETVIRWDVSSILEMQPFEYACGWVDDYLATNANLTPEERQLCN